MIFVETLKTILIHWEEKNLFVLNLCGKLRFFLYIKLYDKCNFDSDFQRRYWWTAVSLMYSHCSQFWQRASLVTSVQDIYVLFFKSVRVQNLK